MNTPPLKRPLDQSPSNADKEARKLTKKARKKERRDRKREQASSSSSGPSEEVTETAEEATETATTTTTTTATTATAATDTHDPPTPTPAPPSSRPAFPFETVAADHAETPLSAYADIAPFLTLLAQCVGRHRGSDKPSDLRIYDPYYCGGSVKGHLASLNFPNCHNEPEDFYDHSERGATGPGQYDVIVTNPPYSGNHVSRLFNYCVASNKPFMLLLPMYFYTEPYYKTTIGQQQHLPNLFFVCPGLGRKRYGYKPPQWSGVERSGDNPDRDSIAPFPSFWFCSMGKHTKTVLKRWKQVNEVTFSGAASGAATNSRMDLFSKPVFVVRTTGDLPNEYKSEFDVSQKRGNPKQRKKMAKKRAEMMGEVLVKKPESKQAAEWRKKAQLKLREEKMKREGK
jgi:hypothetical protein